MANENMLLNLMVMSKLLILILMVFYEETFKLVD